MLVEAGGGDDVQAGRLGDTLQGHRIPVEAHPCVVDHRPAAMCGEVAEFLSSDPFVVEREVLPVGHPSTEGTQNVDGDRQIPVREVGLVLPVHVQGGLATRVHVFVK